MRSKADFNLAYETRCRQNAGPLTIYARLNGGQTTRLGISMGRKVGIAAKRNRIKRLLREAFRLQHETLPAGLDLLIVVRPHQPLQLNTYKQHLLQTAQSLFQRISRQSKPIPNTCPPPATS